MPAFVEPANRVVTDRDLHGIENDGDVSGKRWRLLRAFENFSRDAVAVSDCVRRISRIAARRQKLAFAQDRIPPVKPVWGAQQSLRDRAHQPVRNPRDAEKRGNRNRSIELEVLRGPCGEETA